MQDRAFIKFIFKDNKNSLALGIAGAVTLMQFILFKSFYPFPDFSLDSHNYIAAASEHLSINSFSISYTQFLIILHAFTHSDMALIGSQYFLMELSSLYFYMTILYIYSPSKFTKYVLFAFLFLNPLILYLSNHINSDPLFICFSILWISHLFWIVEKPAPYQVLTQAILLFLCFITQKIASYYPIIAIIAFALSRQPLKTKLAGIAFPVVLILILPVLALNNSKQFLIIRNALLPDGWQVANMALYARQYSSDNNLTSKAAINLDQLSQQFFNQPPVNFDPNGTEYGTNYFIQDAESPLLKYFSTHYYSRNDSANLAEWEKASVFYKQYGEQIIKKHPISMVQHFVLPNVENYFLPPLEILLMYNLSYEEVGYLEQDWFDYKLPNVNCSSKTVQGNILSPFPYIFLFLNILALGSIVWFFVSKRALYFSHKAPLSVYLLAATLIGNFLFTVPFSTSIMRTQVFSMLLTLVFSTLILDLSVKKQPNHSTRLNLNLKTI